MRCSVSILTKNGEQWKNVLEINRKLVFIHKADSNFPRLTKYILVKLMPDYKQACSPSPWLSFLHQGAAAPVVTVVKGRKCLLIFVVFVITAPHQRRDSLGPLASPELASYLPPPFTGWAAVWLEGPPPACLGLWCLARSPSWMTRLPEVGCFAGWNLKVTTALPDLWFQSYDSTSGSRAQTVSPLNSAEGNGLILCLYTF